ncbi:hypothetical protein JCM19237_5167 [Photobacterium aphoticum]|uniref:Uncharacterized protein n=1 Tax=Photobacterium aphoticum TaxID=754436 RepID=A0A090QKC9_9GAMM|nr:hypothetical protein JCM19237_5167 [Photobacterium aphoticum]
MMPEASAAWLTSGAHIIMQLMSAATGFIFIMNLLAMR